MRNLLARALRMGEGKKLRQLQEKVDSVNAWEPEMAPLSDAELAGKTVEFHRRHEEGETLDELLPEAFAVVREASKRALGMRPFDVQIMGGVVLFEGNIAEMKTGEGKTLVATLPVYLKSIAGKGVHVVTVNDYLAKRDSEWMGKIYQFLGLKVGLLQTQMEQEWRRASYQTDVTYGTNSEFGFDYLRDNMAVDADEMVQRGHYYAIVDEVDSILIDEARTPLIISGAPERAADTYKQFARIIPLLKDSEDYEIDEKTRTVAVTEAGVTKVEKALKIDNLYDHVNSQLVNHLNQALRANTLFRKDVDYVIKDGEIIIVDEFTGRLMFGRRYSEGLHQAIEAKEKVRVREENQTLATITLQNYFRMYETLGGMTGTAATEADEFRHIYKLETVTIPTHMPMVRSDEADLIYKSLDAKFTAVAGDIVERHAKGQPVLVGTISIEKSEHLSSMLKKRGVKHEVLNAKHHEREAEIISLAGQAGAVTIATNMAGRGTDIVLGEGVVDVGGLHVLGTERHESRRIDNQLRGRSGRQGDPGSSQFYLSLEDDLMKLFGMDRVRSMMDRLNLPDDYPIEHSLVSKTIESAQRQVEAQNFEIRKQVLKYDDVMNQQREIIYAQRQEILFGEDITERTKEIVSDAVLGSVETFTNAQTYSDEWDWDGLTANTNQLLPIDVKVEQLRESATQEELHEFLYERAMAAYDTRVSELGADLFHELQRNVLLQVVDTKWREHLYEMDALKEGIGLRAIGQRDPLIEYQTEGYAMFQDMVGSIKNDFVQYVFHAQVVQEMQQIEAAAGGGPGAGTTDPAGRRGSPGGDTAGDKVGRNDPCPCGSGKKYKKCCGA
ncbi:MAG: preprotein translocase subunit SecA [Actinomycetota bacterium]|nr:preprotein translocase subunit SecA [Actinomycetota bacterium]